MPPPFRDSTLSSPDAPDDATLIARLRQSDATALDRLVRTYATALIAYAARHVGSDDQAQEIVQEVFLHLWSERTRLEPTHHIAPYLYWLTRNRAIDIVRSESSARRREQQWATHREIDTGDPDTSTSLYAIEASEIRAEVWGVLEAVPPRCREIFMLVWDKQMSYSDIAQLFEISVPTVRNQMSRAIRHLAEVLGPRFHPE